MSRISRGFMFMEIANIVAERGTCDRAKVGAVIAHKGRIISIGYNGSPSGEPHCDDVGHLMDKGHCIRTIHAEVNAITFADNLIGDRSEQIKVSLYVTHLPCESCAQYIAAANGMLGSIKITEVIYGKKYPYDIEPALLAQRFKILTDGGVELIGELNV